MPNTAPHNIYYPDAATNISPLHPVLGAMSTSVETALTTIDGVVSGHTSSITALNTQTINWYATTSARDAAIPTPTTGRVVVTGTGTGLVTWVYNGTSWVDASITSKGGITFALSGSTYTASTFPVVGFAAGPLNSWGNTSWRNSPTDNTACFVTAGVYRLTAQLSFARSGDSDSFTISGVSRSSGGYFRLEVVGLNQPNTRLIGRINGTGMDSSISSSLYVAVAVTTTAVGARFTVERIGD